MIASWWRRRRDARVLRERAIADPLWLDVLRDYPFLKLRSIDELLRLRELTTLFLSRKEFSVARGLQLTDHMAVSIAAQACVPILKLGLEWYDDFVGIVVHPDEVVAQREWMDEDGVVHEGEEVLAGEAMPGGPVMLSWRDVQAATDGAETGYNVVIHEFVHVLDMRGGRQADGIPPLADAALRARWQDVMPRALEVFQAAVDSGVDTFLDPYAAHGLEEFFPVAAECFFVAPLDLLHEQREVYALLRDFFGQDPQQYAR
jgi:MtfA peptidase